MAWPSSMSVKLQDNNVIDYVVVGKGHKSIVCIPGLSDGLGTVKGKHILLSHYYRRFKKDYKLYIFSRRREIPTLWSIDKMADNLVLTCNKIGLTNPHIIGISMGGMIAQSIAIKHPNFFDKMILGITSSKSNPTIQQVVSNWINLVESDNAKEFSSDLYSKTYTDNYLKKVRWIRPALNLLFKIKDKDRFIKQANACLNFDVHEKLSEVHKPIFVIGGDSDKVVGLNSSEKIHKALPTSQLKIFKCIGHSLCEERQKEFDEEVLSFFKGSSHYQVEAKSGMTIPS